MKSIKRTLYPFLILLTACGSKAETTVPKSGEITESVYASGSLKSDNQYVVFPKVSGTIEQLFVNSGDTVFAGQPILSILNPAQKLTALNAELTATFNAYTQNQDKLKRAAQALELARSKVAIDSTNLVRQEALSKTNVGTQFELEQSQLSLKNSRFNYMAAQTDYLDLKRQLSFNAAQSRTNAQITRSAVNDFTVVSQIDGIVYQMDKTAGDLVTGQTPIAVIGDAKKFILEMEVDEADILSISIGQSVLVTLDSYSGSSLKAKITKIHQLMDERSRTFKVEAEFIDPPKVLYPNMNFEANIIIQTKKKAMLIPRNYLIDGAYVMKEDGDKVKVKTGLKNYDFVEILDGLSYSDKLTKPE